MKNKVSIVNKKEIMPKECEEYMDFFIDVQDPYWGEKELANVVNKELRRMDCKIDSSIIKEAIRKYSDNGKDDYQLRFY